VVEVKTGQVMLIQRFFDKFFPRIKIQCMMYFNYPGHAAFIAVDHGGVKICTGRIMMGWTKGNLRNGLRVEENLV
jgi:hypothetical protein